MNHIDLANLLEKSSFNRGLLILNSCKNLIESKFDRKIENSQEPDSNTLLYLCGNLAYSIQSKGETSTSEFYVRTLINKALDNYNENNKAAVKSIDTDSILEKLYSIQFLTKTGDKIRFYHSTLQDFFAGYSMLNHTEEVVLTKTGNNLWNNPLEYYCYFVNDSTLLISHALEKGKIFKAADYLLICCSCEHKVKNKLYSSLLNLVTDKFQFNRSTAAYFLIRYKDETIDKLINERIRDYPPDKTTVFKSIRTSREKFFLDGQRINKTLNSILSKKETGNFPGEHQSKLSKIIEQNGKKAGYDFLVNYINDKNNPVEFRAECIRHFILCADLDSITYIDELISDNNPALYNPAYEVKYYMQNQFICDTVFDNFESAEDFSFDYLLDKPTVDQNYNSVKIILNKTSRNTAIINNFLVNFGPVSGRIFYFLSKNTTSGEYNSIVSIQKYLNTFGIHLTTKSINSRICHIRRKISKSFEGRIDSKILLELSRGQGYRINAEVKFN